jgi:hypothetical protein
MKQGAHNPHATASENGANDGFLGARQSADNRASSALDCAYAMSCNLFVQIVMISRVVEYFLRRKFRII